MKGSALAFLAPLLIVAVIGPAIAQSTPSVNLEGTGDMLPLPGPTSHCAKRACRATIGATLSGQIGGSAVQSQGLQLYLTVQMPASPTEAWTRAGCYPATGSGGTFASQYGVGFFGMYCATSTDEFLTGTVSMVLGQIPFTDQPTSWIAGALQASGPLHLLEPGGNPVGISGTMVVSIVGTVAQVPPVVP